jgi:hypothetical protein
MGKIEHLLKDFNADAVNKLFCSLDEVTPYNRSHRNADALKDIFVSRKMRVERKGFDAEHVDDARNFVATTQNEDGFKFELGERRQCLFEVANTYCKPPHGRLPPAARQKYFARLLGARDADGGVPARDATDAEVDAVARQFYWFLMRRDIAGFDPRDFPTCAARESQMELHAPPVQRFLEEWEAGGSSWGGARARTSRWRWHAAPRRPTARGGATGRPPARASTTRTISSRGTCSTSP